MRSSRVYNSIKDIVQAGFTLLEANSNDLNNDQFLLWFAYSSSELERVSKSYNPSIYTNYLRLQILVSNSSASQKLNACLIYLVEVMKSI